METKLLEHVEKVRYFQVVGESGSIQEAARKIGIAQPALSKSIKILEEAVGCLLLERTRKGTLLTKEGASLLEFSYGMQDLIKNFESTITTSSHGISGQLNIGTHELYVPHLWPQVFDVSSSLSPNLELKLHTDVKSSSLIEQLKTQQLDVVIAIDSKASPGINKSLLYQDKYSFYCSTNFRGEIKKADQAFYLPNSVVNEQQKLQDLLVQNNLNLSPMYNVSSYASILSLILSGVGFGILPDRPASFYVKKKIIKKVTKVRLKQTPHQVFIYTRSSSRDNRSIQFFISQVLKRSY